MGIQERKKREKENRRQQIMIAAKSVFAEKGFSRATMEDIANRAELSPGTLYLYFKNKKELNVSLSTGTLQYLCRKIDNIKRTDKNCSSEKMIKLIRTFYEISEIDSQLLVNLFHLQSSEILEGLSCRMIVEIKDFSTRIIDAISDIIKEGISCGDYIDESPLMLADTLWASFSGSVLWADSQRIIYDREGRVKDTLDGSFRVFLRGIQR